MKEYLLLIFGFCILIFTVWSGFQNNKEIDKCQAIITESAIIQHKMQIQMNLKFIKTIQAKCH